MDANHHNKRPTGTSNNGKRSSIDKLLVEWRRVMQLICDDMWLNGYLWQEGDGWHEFNPSRFKYDLPKYLEYKRFHVDTCLSAWMVSSLVTQLSGKLRSICSKNAARLYVFDKEASHSRYLERLWHIIEGRNPVKPDLSDSGIEISSKCAEFIPTPNGKFYGLLRIRSNGLPIFSVPVCRQMDADINAAKNHEIELPAISRSTELSKLAKDEGFFWLPDGLFSMDGSVLRVPNTTKSQ